MSSRTSRIFEKARGNGGSAISGREKEKTPLGARACNGPIRKLKDPPDRQKSGLWENLASVGGQHLCSSELCGLRGRWDLAVLSETDHYKQPRGLSFAHRRGGDAVTNMKTVFFVRGVAAHIATRLPGHRDWARDMCNTPILTAREFATACGCHYRGAEPAVRNHTRPSAMRLALLCGGWR